jgi:hypothetical protein
MQKPTKKELREALSILLNAYETEVGKTLSVVGETVRSAVTKGGLKEYTKAKEIFERSKPSNVKQFQKEKF